MHWQLRQSRVPFKIRAIVKWGCDSTSWKCSSVVLLCARNFSVCFDFCLGASLL